MLEPVRALLSLFDREWMAFLITLPRLYGFLAGSQVFAPTAVPRLARTAVVFVLAIPAAPVHFEAAAALKGHPFLLAAHFGKDYAIGLLLGYLIGWIVWTVGGAGALIDNQRGAAIASSIDPLLGQESSPLGLLFSQAFVTYIMATGAFLGMLGVAYGSFRLWPAGRAMPILGPETPALVLQIFDAGMAMILLLAGPIVAAMFIAEFALALVSRFAPQIQVFVVAMPIKSGIAALMLVFYCSYLLPFATRKLIDQQGAIAGYFRLIDARSPPGPAR
ncbi:type III secretion system export apparatus subunit SctT [Alsobacter sp. SYSU M60028]|uniref:Type III secretion system export apparatus subunit SctT n=1 Tax=Alsobacter ponti TaxID=2962936 RepID=A0ABT1LH07_9HYPH|nr:type III secretion system export apparatus subunit SctT [Alsobacter ponti]MCP8939528.1 type III secretion system export apparatus subunit SctT [Alsobacter ponti]